MSVLVFVLVFGSCEAYRNRDAGLTEIPVAEIAPTDTIVDLQSNELSNIDGLCDIGFVNLQRLHLSYNQYAEFPDLGCVAQTLQVLKLHYNFIAYVPPELLGKLSVLEELTIGGSPITTIPESSLPIRSLEILGLAENDIAEVDAEAVAKSFPNVHKLNMFNNFLLTELPSDLYAYLPHVTLINVEGCPIHRLPNPCLHNISLAGPAFEAELKFDQGVICDSQLIPYLLAQDLNRVRAHDNGNPPVCMSPEHLIGRPVHVDSLSISELTSDRETQGYVRKESFVPVHPLYSCIQPGVTQVEKNKSIVACAVMCINTQDCAEFGYNPPGRRCALASSENMDTTSRVNFAQWYKLTD